MGFSRFHRIPSSFWRLRPSKKLGGMNRADAARSGMAVLLVGKGPIRGITWYIPPKLEIGAQEIFRQTHMRSIFRQMTMSGWIRKNQPENSLIITVNGHLGMIPESYSRPLTSRGREVTIQLIRSNNAQSMSLQMAGFVIFWYENIRFWAVQ